jgi:hypothetical protein
VVTRPARTVTASLREVAHKRAPESTSCYPRWFSYFQARLADVAGGNQMAWAYRMIPVFG